VDINKKWFFLHQNTVTGPLSETQLTKHHEQHPEGLIWGQGLSEWQSFSEWQEKLNLLKEVLDSLQTDMTPVWWMRDDQAQSGPMTYHKLIQLLKNSTAAGDIELKQDPGHDWLSIYDFPTIVEEVGVSRRQHDRAPFSGIFRFEKAGQSFDAEVNSISEGGIGITYAPYLSAGDILKGSLVSPLLTTEIFFEAEVLYQRRDTTWGLRYYQISHENKSLVLSYIKKFLVLHQTAE